MAPSATKPSFAKNESAKACGSRRNKLRSNLRLVTTAREVFPTRTAIELSAITGYSVRTAEYWLTGKKRVPMDAFVALLHTDDGREFLAGVMTNDAPLWWQRLKAFFKAIDLAAARRAHNRRMKALLDGDFGDDISDAEVLPGAKYDRPVSAKVHAFHRALVGRKGKAR